MYKYSFINLVTGLLFFFFPFLTMAQSLKNPQRGIKSIPSAVKVPSPHQWTTREFLILAPGLNQVIVLGEKWI